MIPPGSTKVRIARSLTASQSVSQSTTNLTAAESKGSELARTEMATPRGQRDGGYTLLDTLPPSREASGTGPADQPRHHTDLRADPLDANGSVEPAETMTPEFNGSKLRDTRE
ncbi:uncharacterized protein L3040_004979 [Drepanopeziza brunnea f. sp. 'multigermtubi']|uniref:uncharacterized protein n=1 Tax=Drepanopeziza brunnea f. sp. 'multigermtubi' TaxID=698441 RepID=UPI0023991960|nr:hypothetical protein L3040_004979 [Drepanopeziza brunnea f. sp. 'multigermtubi']